MRMLSIDIETFSPVRLAILQAARPSLTRFWRLWWIRVWSSGRITRPSSVSACQRGSTRIIQSFSLMAFLIHPSGAAP